MRARAAIIGIAIAALAGCGGGDDGGTPAQPVASGSGLPQDGEPVEVDPQRFSADITNRYWPMKPGTRWTYRETDGHGGESKVVVTATSVTKKVAAGVTARVVRDTVSEDGKVVEDTFDWYAQDEDGNVWYMGEDTAEFEHGEVATREGSFEAGKDGAQPGVIMPADPGAGMAYRQEYLKGEAEDRGEVLSADEQVRAPAGHWDGALLTKDTTPLEPDVVEYKLYAPGTGPVLTLTVSGGSGREELLHVEHVDPAAAKAAGTAALGESYP